MVPIIADTSLKFSENEYYNFTLFLVSLEATVYNIDMIKIHIKREAKGTNGAEED